MKKFYIFMPEPYKPGSGNFVEVEGTTFKNAYRLDLFYHKPDNLWAISENRTGLQLARGKTKKAVTEYALERLAANAWVKDTVESCKVISPAYGGELHAIGKLEKYASQFESIFNQPLRYFWDTMFGVDLGFDVIKFDERFIKPIDGQSTSEAVLEKYGQEAVELCKALLA